MNLYFSYTPSNYNLNFFLLVSQQVMWRYPTVLSQCDVASLGYASSTSFGSPSTAQGSTTLDRKRIYANPSAYPNTNPKRKYVFGLTKWRHFSIKCNDTAAQWLMMCCALVQCLVFHRRCPVSRSDLNGHVEIKVPLR